MKEETVHRTDQSKESSDMKLLKGKDINIRSTGEVEDVKLEGTSASWNLGDGIRYLKPINADVSHIELDHYRALNNYDKPLQEFFRNADDINRIFLINMALRCNLFDILEENQSCDVKCVTQRLNMKESTIDCANNFMDQLYAYGFLERSGWGKEARYWNSEYTKKYFLKNSPQNYTKLYYNLYKGIKRIDIVEKNMKDGNNLLLSDDIYNNDLDRDAYWDYYYKTNMSNFENLLQTVCFKGFKKICDLQGGRGLLASRLKQCCSNCEVISFENSKMKNYVDSSFSGDKLGVRLEFGDLLKDELPESDCFILPQLLIHYNKEHKRSIIKNCYNRLNPNGQIFIMENLLDDERQKDSCGLKMEFFFAMQGYEGIACTFNCYKDLLTLSGFKFIERIPGKNGASDIICAKKAVS